MANSDRTSSSSETMQIPLIISNSTQIANYTQIDHPSKNNNHDQIMPVQNPIASPLKGSGNGKQQGVGRVLYEKLELATRQPARLDSRREIGGNSKFK